MITDLDMRVLELVCSRLCHELVSPVGAINNGIELIEEMGQEMAEEAIGLIAHSADQASRRLRVLRLAYGAAGGEGGLDDAAKAAAAYFAGGKIALDWPATGLAPPTGRRGLAKLLLNLTVLGEEALPHGGTITIRAGTPAVPEASAPVHVTAAGTKAGLRPESAAALAGGIDGDALSARNIHAFITRRFATQYGFGLDAAFETGRAVFSIA
jgi:histidine phosphotransferase ChpT